MRPLLAISLLTVLASCQQWAGYDSARAPAVDSRAKEAGAADAASETALFDGAAEGQGDALVAEAGPSSEGGVISDALAPCVDLVPGKVVNGLLLKQYNDGTFDTVAFLEKAEVVKVPTTWTRSHMVNCLLAMDNILDISASSGSVSPFCADWGFFYSDAWPALGAAIDQFVAPEPFVEVWYHSWGPADLTLVAVLFYGTTGDVVYLRGHQLME